MAAKHSFDAQPRPSRKGAIDKFTREGAEAIARSIEQHWRQLGFDQVRAWVEPFDEFSREKNPVFVVRSNLKLASAGSDR
jgi:hypothetical protein